MHEIASAVGCALNIEQLARMDKQPLLFNEVLADCDCDQIQEAGDSQQETTSPKLTSFSQLQSTMIPERSLEEACPALEAAFLQETTALCKYLDLPSILPIIRSHHLVTGDEYLQLLRRWEAGLRESSIGLLLEMLPRKHPNWAELFFRSLQEEKEHRGHTHIIEVLETAIQHAPKVCI